MVDKSVLYKAIEHAESAVAELEHPTSRQCKNVAMCLSGVGILWLLISKSTEDAEMIDARISEWKQRADEVEAQEKQQ